MTAAKKSVTKKRTAKKAFASKAKKRPSRKAAKKAAPTRKTSARKKAAKKKTARKKAAKKTVSRKSTTGKAAQKTTKKTTKKSGKKTVSRKATTKKAVKKTTKKAGSRKATSKKAAKKSTKKTSKRTVKKSTKKAVSRKATRKKAAKKSTKKAASRKATSNKAIQKKQVAKKANAKKVAKKASKKTVKKASKKASRATSKRSPAGSKRKTPGKKRKVGPRKTAAMSKMEMEAFEELHDAIESDLLENFEGWGAPSETSTAGAHAQKAEPGTRAEREADFDELLDGDKPAEDWSSTTVFESDSGVEHALEESVQANVAVTSLVVLPESAPAQECRIEQPDPEQEAEFEEFAAEEIISILDESLAMDLDAQAAQAEPKDESPAPESTPTAPQALEDEVEMAQPTSHPARSGFFSRLWRMMISSDPD